ncbi:3-deoxy-D-manno-octulosonic-acid transferase [Chitinophaga costaii]|uniref:3-deoxy-D-manno-octulosonic acid transferase n=1 Tax=Chitinophaga costaii TaxID=1335309 RepID=A0A1C3ZZU2_9BACT|nr:glycosyltransferase N-terminal domain-containing protein [Chitinophaga costaii]PUZ30573.1 3-deoxy-D-manno-octulosonic acid transferase [Chitinophaga costaii]SCB87806.1 3-deoxy-D-manno-octulosonic-acid transferase [Chitinophaga costaii]
MILFSGLYNLGIAIYYFAITLSAWAGKVKARLWKQGRYQWPVRMHVAIPPGTPLIWVHAASLGEFEQGRPVLEALRSHYPSYKILLTFFSPSGYEVRKDYQGADYIFYLPLDTRRNARIFLDIAQPRLALFIKYEFWYHFLTALHARNIPTLLVSGIFRPQQVFFKWYGGLFRQLLERLTHIFVQDDRSLQLLTSAGIKNVSRSGDTRFDRVWALRNEKRTLPLIEQFCTGKHILVAGSTWPEDEQLLAACWSQMLPDMALILAPHEVHTTRIDQLMAMFPQAQRYTRLAAGEALHSNVLIIDNVGMLSALYHYAMITYVGGGFGKEGIHNILEPATYGKPVLFGPIFDKFPEAPALIAVGGGFIVKDAASLLRILQLFVQDTTAWNTAAQAAAAYVEAGQGATGKVLTYIAEKRFLSNP